MKNTTNHEQPRKGTRSHKLWPNRSGYTAVPVDDLATTRLAPDLLVAAPPPLSDPEKTRYFGPAIKGAIFVAFLLILALSLFPLGYPFGNGAHFAFALLFFISNAISLSYYLVQVKQRYETNRKKLSNQPNASLFTILGKKEIATILFGIAGLITGAVLAGLFTWTNVFGAASGFTLAGLINGTLFSFFTGGICLSFAFRINSENKRPIEKWVIWGTTAALAITVIGALIASAFVPGVFSFIPNLGELNRRYTIFGVNLFVSVLFTVIALSSYIGKTIDYFYTRYKGVDPHGNMTAKRWEHQLSAIGFVIGLIVFALTFYLQPFGGGSIAVTLSAAIMAFSCICSIFSKIGRAIDETLRTPEPKTSFLRPLINNKPLSNVMKTGFGMALFVTLGFSLYGLSLLATGTLLPFPLWASSPAFLFSLAMSATVCIALWINRLKFSIQDGPSSQIFKTAVPASQILDNLCKHILNTPRVDHEILPTVGREPLFELLLEHVKQAGMLPSPEWHTSLHHLEKKSPLTRKDYFLFQEARPLLEKAIAGEGIKIGVLQELRLAFAKIKQQATTNNKEQRWYGSIPSLALKSTLLIAVVFMAFASIVVLFNLPGLGALSSLKVFSPLSAVLIFGLSGAAALALFKHLLGSASPNSVASFVDIQNKKDHIALATVIFKFILLGIPLIALAAMPSIFTGYAASMLGIFLTAAWIIPLFSSDTYIPFSSRSARLSKLNNFLNNWFGPMPLRDHEGKPQAGLLLAKESALFMLLAGISAIAIWLCGAPIYLSLPAIAISIALTLLDRAWNREQKAQHNPSELPQKTIDTIEPITEVSLKRDQDAFLRKQINQYFENEFHYGGPEDRKAGDGERFAAEWKCAEAFFARFPKATKLSRADLWRAKPNGDPKFPCSFMRINGVIYRLPEKEEEKLDPGAAAAAPEAKKKKQDMQGSTTKFKDAFTREEDRKEKEVSELILGRAFRHSSPKGMDLGGDAKAEDHTPPEDIDRALLREKLIYTALGPQVGGPFFFSARTSDTPKDLKNISLVLKVHSTQKNYKLIRRVVGEKLHDLLVEKKGYDDQVQRGTDKSRLPPPPPRLTSYLQVLQIALHTAHSLENIHRKGIQHDDLNPENILVHMRPDGHIIDAKLIDFDKAHAIQKKVLTNRPCGEKIDIYDLGKLFDQLVRAINFDWKKDPRCSNLKSLVDKMLEYNNPLNIPPIPEVIGTLNRLIQQEASVSGHAADGGGHAPPPNHQSHAAPFLT